MKAAFSDLKAELRASSGRDFERLVFPWVKLIFPELVMPSALKDLDKKGVDFAFVVPDSVFPVVIQCKGFEVASTQLTDSHVKQVRGSVKSFLKSNLKCRRYMVLYNRDGDNRDYARAAETEISALVTAGAAETAELWSLGDLVKELNRELTRKVLECVSLWCSEMERLRKSLFSFSEVFIEDVPVARQQWSLDAGARKSTLKSQTSISGTHLPKLLLDRREGCFSLVIGAYGMGKSTMMRHFPLPDGYKRLLVPAGVLKHIEHSGGSEAALLEYLLRHTRCLVGLATDISIESNRLERVASACLMSAFHSGQEKTVLIIDGLDENRIYSRPDGFQLLANELARLRIPVILTTRREHFYNRYLELQPEQQRNWLSRSVETTVFELSEWSREHCALMLEQVSRLQSEQTAQLEPLRKLLFEEKLPLVFSHPLWLAMAIDLALAGRAAMFDDQFELFDSWTQQKLIRDVLAPNRAIPDAWKGQAVFAHQMTNLMTQVAVKMTKVSDGSMELLETIDEDEVQEMIRKLLPTSEDLSDVVAQTSLLTPVSIRTTAAPLRLRFSHYSLHEFYVAKAMRDGKLGIGGCSVPEGVSGFLANLRSVFAVSSDGSL